MPGWGCIHNFSHFLYILSLYIRQHTFKPSHTMEWSFRPFPYTPVENYRLGCGSHHIESVENFHFILSLFRTARSEELSVRSNGRMSIVRFFLHFPSFSFSFSCICVSYMYISPWWLHGWLLAGECCEAVLVGAADVRYLKEKCKRKGKLYTKLENVKRFL